MPDATLIVATNGDLRQFAPGQEVRGRCLWELPEAPESVEIRLVWFTRGKGTPDSAIVTRKVICQARKEGEQAFSFQLPDEPFSFSGRLITLTWGIELYCLPGGESQVLEIVNAPGGQEVRI